MKTNKLARLSLLLTSAAVLSACGGGTDASDAETKAAQASPTVTQSSSAPSMEDAMVKAAQLNAQDLAQALTAAQDTSTNSASTSAAKSATKAGARTAPIAATQVFRFYNTLNQAHFFTSSVAERDSVLASIRTMTYDGPAFYAASQSETTLQPVYRFRNLQSGVHFYTISEQEKAYIQANLASSFVLEGEAYRASTTPGVGLMPLYRFYLASKGFHLYSSSEAEVASIRANLPQYTYEGVSYYVPNPSPSATVVSPLGGEVTWNIPANISVVLSGPFGAPVSAMPACSSADSTKVTINSSCTSTTAQRLDARDVVTVTGGGYSVKLPLTSAPQRHWSGRKGVTDGYGMVVTADNRALIWSGSYSSYDQVLGQGATRTALCHLPHTHQKPGGQRPTDRGGAGQRR